MVVKAPFINASGNRLDLGGILRLTEEAAEHVGLRQPESKRMNDHFSPHYCGHWMTTHLRRAGMSGLYDKKTMLRQPIRTAAALLERVRGAFTCPGDSAFQDRNSHILQMQQNVNR